MHLLIAEVRGPLFSVRPLESVVIQRTWLLPPPGTVLGAIAHALAVSGQIDVTRNNPAGLHEISEAAIKETTGLIEESKGFPLCGSFLGKTSGRMIVNRFLLKRSLPPKDEKQIKQCDEIINIIKRYRSNPSELKKKLKAYYEEKKKDEKKENKKKNRISSRNKNNKKSKPKNLIQSLEQFLEDDNNFREPELDSFSRSLAVFKRSKIERDDARLKEYAYSKKLFVYAFLKDRIRLDKIFRLGDTESMFSLTSVKYYDNVNVRDFDEVDVPVQGDSRTLEKVRGTYAIDSFPSPGGWSKNDYNKSLRTFVLPLRNVRRNIYEHETIRFSESIVKGVKVSLDDQEHVIGWTE